MNKRPIVATKPETQELLPKENFMLIEGKKNKNKKL
jgi:hypothetical protein